MLVAFRYGHGHHRKCGLGSQAPSARTERNLPQREPPLPRHREKDAVDDTVSDLANTMQSTVCTVQGSVAALRVLLDNWLWK